MKTLGCPIHFSATSTQIDRAAPDLGQHTTEILLSYGYTEADVQLMYEQGSIA
jgi:crotonobetainyl-CoA:carnitine CoA-transferase CaiB-like acyl-CoA transferase